MIRRSILLLSVFMGSAFASMAQDGKNDFMSSTGKIYVVVAVVLVILILLILYLFYLDRKIGRVEKQLHDGNKGKN